MSKKRLFSKNQFCPKCYIEEDKMRKLFKYEGTKALICPEHGYIKECTECKAADFDMEK